MDDESSPAKMRNLGKNRCLNFSRYLNTFHWYLICLQACTFLRIELLFPIAQTQLTFTCSKSTVQTLEKDVKYVQSL